MVIALAPSSSLKLLTPSVKAVTTVGILGLLISIICTASSTKDATKA